MMHAAVNASGMVVIHTIPIRRTVDQRMRSLPTRTPTPISALSIVCVLLTGLPIPEALRTTTADANWVAKE